jgi:hypothetical protein
VRALALLLPLVASCAHAPGPPAPTLELALDEGRPSERPLTPQRTFEMLMQFDPQLPAYKPLGIRFLLAQPGRIVLTVYRMMPDGGPGLPLATIERDYGIEWCSGPGERRWIVERLDLPVQKTPLYVGIFSPGAGDPRLWATSNETRRVFQRDPDPSTPMSSTAIPRTPILRLDIAPSS